MAVMQFLLADRFRLEVYFKTRTFRCLCSRLWLRRPLDREIEGPCQPTPIRHRPRVIALSERIR